MNRKSRIKSTLDSLFTSGKIRPETPQPEADTGKVNENIQPSKDKVKLSTPKKKTSQTNLKKEKKVEDNDQIAETSTNGDSLTKSNLVPPNDQDQAESAISQVDKRSEVVVNPESLSPAAVVSENNKVDADHVQKLAAEIDKARGTKSDDDEHLVVFTLGEELYGVTIQTVESIIKIQAITEVPRTAAYVLGVTNLRGTVVPVLDLRKRFNLEFIETTSNTRIIIINTEGSKVGIVVDEVTEVLKVSQNAIQPPPPMATSVDSAFISGIAKINNKLVILLDLVKVLASSGKQYSR
jgi:purine-binding chemotaxis protein CheW